MTTGIRKLHSKGCTGRDGGRCTCGAGWEASVFSKRDGKKIRKTFPNRAEAKTWRDDANTQLAKGGLRAPKPTTLREAWEAWHEAAKAGTIRNRSGDRYKPSAIRGYDQGMRLRVLPEFGSVRLSELDRIDLQRFVYRLLENGLAPPTIDVTLLPVRAIYRHALERGEVAVNPCANLSMPRSDRRRDRIADPVEGAALLAAVPLEDRPLWATAMYAGLRRGEIQALRASDVDLAGGLLRVEFGWDYKEGPIELKSNAGRRKVPIPAILRDHLLEQRLRAERDGERLFFGRRTGADPFYAEQVQRRADKAWKAAGLERITFHECRHTYASLMIAAGVNAKALSTYMGHANISITMDRYGHLMPGSEDEAAGLLDTYLTAQLEQAAAQARGATGEQSGERLANEAPEPLV
jgi:integrase